MMFLGSFYGVFIRAFLFLALMFLYASVLQTILHLCLKKPARFSKILAIFFTVTSMLYLLFFIPVIGIFLFLLGFIYFAGKEIGKTDGFSTFKGIMLIIAPKLIFLLIIFFAAASLLNVVSFF